MNKKVCLAVGGGLDSWAVALTLSKYMNFDLFFMDYGQFCAPQEFSACLELSERINKKLLAVKNKRISLVNSDGLLFGLGDNPIVKLRNLEIIQTAACEGYDIIYLSLLNERGIMFPDANLNFIQQVRSLYYEAYNISVDAPFIDRDKWDFVVDAHHNDNFLDRAFTCWTPVNGKQCGKCSHCEKLLKIQNYYGEKYVTKNDG